jgi:hypothetical protein
VQLFERHLMKMSSEPVGPDREERFIRESEHV